MAGLMGWALIGGRELSACLLCAVTDSRVMSGRAECSDSGLTLVSSW